MGYLYIGDNPSIPIDCIIIIYPRLKQFYMDVKDVIETFHNSSHEGLHALIEYLELEDNQSKLYNYFNSFSNYDLKTQKSNRVFADIVGKIISEDSPEDEDTKGAEDTLKVITQ